MMHNIEFSLVHSERSKSPHIFEAFRHSTTSSSWHDTVVECLDSWRIIADAFYDVTLTGFKSERLLNTRGKVMLPVTPLEDADVTKNPYITDITEIIALRLLRTLRPLARFPHPRVKHKESRPLQHHGIDIIGFEESPDGVTLLIVEVMASVQRRYPASTVYQHKTQLLDETLKQAPPQRLIDDLAYVQGECRESEDRDTLNGIIVAVMDGELTEADGQLAVPILLRPKDAWKNDDWTPFTSSLSEFEQAKIPATVCFLGIECDCAFSQLMELVKKVASSTSFTS